MIKPVVSDFIREAIREKASRELSVLQQRSVALDGVEHAKETIGAIATELTVTASALATLAPDPSIVAKLRRLRKAIEDAQTLSTEIADALSIDEQRTATDSSRASILRALGEAGLEPEVMLSQAAQ